MTQSDRNRAWLRKIEDALASLPPGQRTGSVTIHFTEGAAGAAIRHLDWHRRDTSLDPSDGERIAS